MTYSELISRLSDEMDLSKSETRKMMAEITSALILQLGDEDEGGFTIPGLGTFRTRFKEIQKVYNPHYEAYILVPPKQIVDFSPGKELKKNIKFKRP